MLWQRGFSLVELMVATALALLTGLAVLQVLSNYQTRQQTTTGRNDSQLNAGIGLYQLSNQIRMAGAGLITSNGFICNVGLNSYNLGQGTVSNSAPFHPLRIVDGGGTAPDMIDISRTNARAGAAPANALVLMPAATSAITVDSTTGLQAGDLYVIGSNDGSKVCTLQQFTIAPINNGTTWSLNHDAAPAAPYNPVNPAASFTNPMVYDVADLIIGIGNSWQNRFRLLCDDGTGTPSNINRCSLVSYDLYSPPANLTLATSTNLVDQVFDLQAQYGIADIGSQTVNNWVDATGTWSPATLTSANIRRIKAVRVTLVTRGPWDAALVAPVSLTYLGNRTRTLTNDERHYRYTVLTTIVPLVNIIWAGM